MSVLCYYIFFRNFFSFRKSAKATQLWFPSRLLQVLWALIGTRKIHVSFQYVTYLKSQKHYLFSKMYFAFENQFIEPDDLLLVRMDEKNYIYSMHGISWLKNTYKLIYFYCLNRSKYLLITITFEIWNIK